MTFWGGIPGNRDFCLHLILFLMFFFHPDFCFFSAAGFILRVFHTDLFVLFSAAGFVLRVVHMFFDFCFLHGLIYVACCFIRKQVFFA